MTRKNFRWLAVSCALAIKAYAAGEATAQDIESAFRGKTVRILIPTGPGGDRALYTLPLAASLGRHIPGNPTVSPAFMPGAGGSQALNYVYSVADPDGLTIVTPLASVLNAQLIANKSVKYDARKFRWIGRTDDATRVLMVTNKVTVETLDDLRKTEVVVGAVGQASDTATNAVFMNQLFGTKFKVINGYGASNKIMLAMLAGETQGAFTTWNNVRSNQAGPLKVGEIRPILQIGFTVHPELPKVPLMLDLAKTDAEKQMVRLMASSTLMGQSFAGPPALSDPLLAAHRRAFDATMKDPDFISKMAAIGVKFNPVTGEDLTKLVEQIMSTPSDAVERYKTVTASE